jgi:hypothetical protein
MARKKQQSTRVSQQTPATGSRDLPIGKTPASGPPYKRIALASFVLVLAGAAFSWVEFYGERPIFPLIKSFSIMSNCTNAEGYLGLMIEGGPVAELDTGLTGQVSCSDIRIIAPGLASNILSVVPRSVAPSGRQLIPESAIKLTQDDTNGISIELFPDKLPKPSGFVSFLMPMTRVSFDTYSALFPVVLNMENAALHPPKSILFSALINADFNVVALRPPSISQTEKVSGEHLATLRIQQDQEVYIEVQSTRLKQIKNLVQWTSAAFFGVAVAYLLALLGLRT